MVLVPEDRRVAGPELTDYLAAHGVTHMILPPSLVAALPAGVQAARGRGAGGRHRGGAGGAGGALGVDDAGGGRIRPDRGDGELHAVVAPNRAGRGPVPIGGPVPNTRLYVLDAALRPVRPGVAGELYLGGAGLARGYLGRPGLTADAVRRRPVRRSPARGCTAPATWRAGRADGTSSSSAGPTSQVKIRGFRVEPGEIETVLLRHPAVRQAAVVARQDQRGGQRLVAYVVGDGATAALREHAARATLPDYMVPAAVRRVAGPAAVDRQRQARPSRRCPSRTGPR